MKMYLLPLLLLLGAWSCHHPAPTPIDPGKVDMAGPPDAGIDLKQCVLDELPTLADSCDGFFNTKYGLNCVVCKGGQGCLDAVDVVYCVNGKTCADDPACTVFNNGIDQLKPMSSRLKKKPTIRHGKMEIVK